MFVHFRFSLYGLSLRIVYIVYLWLCYAMLKILINLHFYSFYVPKKTKILILLYIDSHFNFK